MIQQGSLIECSTRYAERIGRVEFVDGQRLTVALVEIDDEGERPTGQRLRISAGLCHQIPDSRELARRAKRERELALARLAQSQAGHDGAAGIKEIPTRWPRKPLRLYQ